jgi:hypothetical protein
MARLGANFRARFRDFGITISARIQPAGGPVVYETQHWRNPEIANYVDALFTVGALTTTGFGDITLKGSLGRLIAILIMIFGVTPQAPAKHCSAHRRYDSAVQLLLERHELDAVHCGLRTAPQDSR